MKHSIIATAILFTSFLATAQEKTEKVTTDSKEKIKEVGIVFSSLNSYGLTFRAGNQKRVFRFNTLSLNNSKIQNPDIYSINKNENTGIGTSIGIEFRKNITNEFQFRFGVDAIYQYSKQISERYSELYVNSAYTKSMTHNFGGGIVLGVNYVYKEKLVLGAEISPSYLITTGTFYAIQENQDEITISNIDLKGHSIGLSNNSALLSIAYRF